MKKIIYVLCSTVLLSFSSCDKECTSAACLDSSPEIDFEDLKEGQRSYYANYSTTCNQINQSFSFSGDTIRLEVIDLGGVLHFEETQFALLDQPFYEPVRYEVLPQNNYLLIRDRSQSALFFFYANDTLFLDPSVELELKQEDCLLVNNSNPFIGNDIGFTDKFKMGQITWKERTVVSCVPGWMDIDAYLIYTGSELSASHVVSGGFEESQVNGWTKIERN